MSRDTYDNYEERKVDRHDEGSGLVISTYSVTDSDRQYETIVCCPMYCDGDPVVVEEYEVKDNAQEGHDRWVLVMMAEKLPFELIDVSTAMVAKLSDNFGRAWRRKLRGTRR